MLFLRQEFPRQRVQKAATELTSLPMDSKGANGFGMDPFGEPNKEHMQALEQIMQRTGSSLESMCPGAFGQLMMEWTRRLVAGETVDQIVTSFKNAQRANH